LEYCRRGDGFLTPSNSTAFADVYPTRTTPGRALRENFDRRPMPNFSRGCAIWRANESRGEISEERVRSLCSSDDLRWHLPSISDFLDCYADVPTSGTSALRNLRSLCGVLVLLLAMPFIRISGSAEFAAASHQTHSAGSRCGSLSYSGSACVGDPITSVERHVALAGACKYDATYPWWAPNS
jgi:hypothetical protein